MVLKLTGAGSFLRVPLERGGSQLTAYSVPGKLLWHSLSLSCVCDPRAFVPTVKRAVGTVAQLGQGTSLFVYSVITDIHKTQ